MSVIKVRGVVMCAAVSAIVCCGSTAATAAALSPQSALSGRATSLSLAIVVLPPDPCAPAVGRRCIDVIPGVLQVSFSDGSAPPSS